MDLVLETKPQRNETASIGSVMLTPGINEDYWAWRVKVSERQAIVAFPKFTTVGIGFQIESEDWNTNLPYTVPAEQIYEHIAVNKGDDTITRETCIEAIRMIQEAVSAHMAGGN